MSKNERKQENLFRGFGFFLIALGLVMLAATLDIFGWESINRYYRWEMLLILFGLIMIFKARLTWGILMLGGGIWLILPEIRTPLPEPVRIAYWPAVLILAGITLLLQARRKQ